MSIYVTTVVNVTFGLWVEERYQVDDVLMLTKVNFMARVTQQPPISQPCLPLPYSLQPSSCDTMQQIS